MGMGDVMTIRASSFGGLFDCALRWKKIHLEGMTMPNSPRALIGTGFHAGAAVFDQARIEGDRIKPDDAVGVALDSIRERIAAEGANWRSDEPSPREVDDVTTKITTLYCTKIAPERQWEAVELAVTPMEVETEHGVTVRLTGTLDRARVRAGTHGITDLKSGRSAVSGGKAQTKRHRAQIGTYELLYEHTTGNRVDGPGEILGINTTGTYAHGTGLIHGARKALVGSPETADSPADPGLIEMAARMYRSDLFPPNPQSPLCDARWCPHYARCAYADH